MKMLKISLVAALALGGLLACSTVASAQNSNGNKGKGRGQNIEQRVDNLAKELNLTDDQKTKVKSLFEEQGKKMREMRSDTSVTQEQRREKFTAMRDEQNKKMKEILKPDQYEKYTKIQAEMRKKGPNGGGGKKESQ